MNKYILIIDWDKEPDPVFIRNLSWCGFKQINDNMFESRFNGINSVMDFKSLVKSDKDALEENVTFRNIYLINANEYTHIKGLDFIRKKNSNSAKFDIIHYKEIMTNGSIILKVKKPIILQTTFWKNKIIQYSLPDFNYLTINFSECDEIMSSYDFIKLSQVELVNLYEKYCIEKFDFKDDISTELKEKLLETFEFIGSETLPHCCVLDTKEE